MDAAYFAWLNCWIRGGKYCGVPSGSVFVRGDSYHHLCIPDKLIEMTIFQVLSPKCDIILHFGGHFLRTLLCRLVFVCAGACVLARVASFAVCLRLRFVRDRGGDIVHGKEGAAVCW